VSPLSGPLAGNVLGSTPAVPSGASLLSTASVFATGALTTGPNTLASTGGGAAPAAGTATLQITGTTLEASGQATCQGALTGQTDPAMLASAGQRGVNADLATAPPLASPLAGAPTGAVPAPATGVSITASGVAVASGNLAWLSSAPGLTARAATPLTGSLSAPTGTILVTAGGIVMASGSLRAGPSAATLISAGKLGQSRAAALLMI